MRPNKLSEAQIAAELAQLPSWQRGEDGKISRKLNCRDFVAAFSLLSAVAVEAEKMNHHPEIYNVYNRLEFQLTTHDAGGLTELDFELARRIDERAAGVGA